MTTVSQPHTLKRRLVERFGLVALGLYHLPLFLNNYPSLGGGSGGFSEGLAVSWGHIFTRPGIWLAQILFGPTSSLPMASAGDNGDVGEEYARLILAIAIGVVSAIIWTIADRKRPGAEWVEGAMRVMLRYSIALGLISYALAKILPVQFPPLRAIDYETRIGELTPMRLLWTFMEYSRPYNFFAGLMECVAIVLLCVRRTATLGALVTIAVMTNVALMNIAYDVQVKLYATMIVISAGVLVLYDARRLLAVFVTNRSVQPGAQPTVLEGRLPAALRWAIKLVLVGSVTASSLIAFRPLTAARGLQTSAAEGAWAITATSGPKWQRLVIDSGNVMVRLDGETMMWCRQTPGSDASLIAFTCSRNRKGELRWSVGGTVIHLEGTFDGEKVTMAARRLDEQDYPLMRGGIRLLYDRR